VAIDLGSRDGRGQLVKRAVDDQGRIDVLVNNVGVRLRLKGFLGTSDEDFEWAMNINFFAAMRATRAAVTNMIGRGGAIVNVASVNAFFQPDTGTVDYGAAKAALINLTKALSQELGPQGIRINDVSPGPVSTDLWLGRDGVARTVADATGVDPETAKKNVLASLGGLATRADDDARGSRDPCGDACFPAYRKRHGLELRHRRRPHQDTLSTLPTQPAWAAARLMSEMHRGLVTSCKSKSP
jgi:NAD(P)-dependent dehydrogenase (short-subunit alcohol dehydrogenase family)